MKTCRVRMLVCVDKAVFFGRCSGGEQRPAVHSHIQVQRLHPRIQTEWGQH